jgi:nucleotide-binding universal stress UspA family protein
MLAPKPLRPMKILIAIDGSEHSHAAMQFLRHLPLLPGSEITALAVLPIESLVKKSYLLNVLDEAQLLLADRGLPVHRGLLQGEPAEELSKFADEQQPDLILVGAKGLRATLGILLGGVAQQMIEYSGWPVLVVRTPYRDLKQAALVIDGSICSITALDYIAGSSSRAPFPFPADTQIHVLHVLPALVPFDADDLGGRRVMREETEGKAILSQAVTRLQLAGFNACGDLLRGDAATEIIAYARDHDLRLIISGSRGLSSVKGWLLGSVSRKLVHYAHCSVMVVRCPRSTQAV